MRDFFKNKYYFVKNVFKFIWPSLKCIYRYLHYASIYTKVLALQ